MCFYEYIYTLVFLFLNMNFDELVRSLDEITDVFRQSANSSINLHVTVRNWLVGCYIVEFEQQGENRAEYGAQLLVRIAEKLNGKGLSVTNLKLNRQFYVAYPQLAQIFSSKQASAISQTVSDLFQYPVVAAGILSQNIC